MNLIVSYLSFITLVDANLFLDIDGVTPELLTTWRWLAAKGMESLFTDLEQERRVEVSRMNGGVLLGDVLSQ